MLEFGIEDEVVDVEQDRDARGPASDSGYQIEHLHRCRHTIENYGVRGISQHGQLGVTVVPHVACHPLGGERLRR